MKRVLLFLFILFNLGISISYGYIDKTTLLGEVKFSQGSFTGTKNFNYVNYSTSYFNTFNNGTAPLPSGYVSIFYNGSIYGGLSFLNGIDTQVKSASFWASRFDPSANGWQGYPTTFFSQNGIDLYYISNTLVGINIDGEKVGEFSITAGWHFYTISLDTVMKKLIISVDGSNRIYSFNTDKIKLISNINPGIYHNLSTYRVFNKVLNNDEINIMYNEASILAPTLTQNQSGTTFVFNSPSNSYDINVGKGTDINSAIDDIEYSINGSDFQKYTGLTLNRPNQTTITISLPEKLFFNGNNTLSVRLYNGIKNSSVVNYTVVKSYINDSLVLTGTMLSNFRFMDNLYSQTGTHTFTSSGNITYNKSFVFPYNYISFPDTNGYITYNNTNSGTINTISFLTKGNGELLNNNYFSLSYNNTTGFSLNRGVTKYLTVGPKDTNWHLVTLKLDNVNDILYIDIDGGDYKGNIMYYRDDIINTLKLKTGSFAFFKTFSNQISDGDTNVLYNNYDLTQLFTLSGSYDSHLKIPLYVTDNRLNKTITFYYSIDNINFTKANNISLTTPVMSGSVNISLPTNILTGTGYNTIYFKTYDDYKFSNSISLNVKKSESIINISIDDSGIYKMGDKIMKASINVGNLFYAITKEDTCDDTLNFLPYKDLTFSSVDDNGSKVCYKGVFYDDISYKISRVIDGIGDKTTTVKNSDIFYNFLSWKKGALKDFDALYILITSQIYNSVQGSTTTRSYPKLLTDVNGDGLPDIIYTNYINQQMLYYPVSGGSPTTYYESQYYYSLLINKGNMDYELKYRCVYLGDTGFNLADKSRIGYYGDCAE